ncbi:hypothetical protein EUU23_02735 [Sphingorhabdus sp. IMCC26285]|jgi:hypothetical protein|uniref:Uncharacterized protein n=1 Tax=Sphingorhabdus profundilacus TaxID=2509718 RepID=A0A6I4LWX7_9SPHN|nr:hypothetical protein [Sphingorhabdus profundilacus]MVZ96620.1 hypothetical protein [Sphingorhabdus profundilacus]
MFDEIWILIPLAPFLLGGFAIWSRHKQKEMELGGGQQRMLGEPDALRMHEEIRTLKDRIQVLERIATENNAANDINRQIEQLRDR